MNQGDITPYEQRWLVMACANGRVVGSVESILTRASSFDDSDDSVKYRHKNGLKNASCCIVAKCFDIAFNNRYVNLPTCHHALSAVDRHFGILMCLPYLPKHEPKSIVIAGTLQCKEPYFNSPVSSKRK